MSYTRTKERWLVYLPKHQFEVLSELAREVKGVKGSQMIVEAIEHHIINNLENFRNNLKNMQYKNKLQALNDKKAALLQEEHEIKKLMGDRPKESAAN